LKPDNAFRTPFELAKIQPDDKDDDDFDDNVNDDVEDGNGIAAVG
jgi:hypothetical protein